MAQLGNDPAKEAENTATTNVLGPSAAPQPSQAPSGSQPMGGAQSSPTGTTGAKKGSSGASSGMFQNIKKYAAANKPQASKMAGAVTKDVGSQAAEVGRAVGKQKQQFQTSLDKQQKNLGQAQEFTQGVIGSITGPQQPQQQPMQEGQAPAQPQQAGTSDEDYNKFRGYITGGTEQFGDVAALDVSRQAQQAKQMQSLADQAETSQGRSELLKQTFAKQAPYSAGMRGLDDLIVSSDRGAREQLASGVQGVVDQNVGNVENIRRQALQDLTGYNKGKGEFVSGLKEQLSTGSGDIATDTQARADQMKIDRKTLADKLGVDEVDAQKFMDENLDIKLGNKGDKQTLRDIHGQIGGLGGLEGSKQAGTYGGSQMLELNPNREEYVYETYSPSGFPNMHIPLTGKPKIKNPSYDPNAPKYKVGSNITQTFMADKQAYDKTRDAVSKNYSQEDLELLGLTQEDLNLDITKQRAGARKGRYQYNTAGMDNIINQLQNTVTGKTGRDAMVASFARQGGESETGLDQYYNDLLGGTDISSQSAASQGEVTKYNALQDLLSGRGEGERFLMSDSKNTGTAAGNQEMLNKVRADILKRIGKGESQ